VRVAFQMTSILGLFQGSSHHDLGGPELVAAMDDGDLRGELGEEVGLLHRRVTSTHHDHFLVAKEEPVAGGTGGDTSPREALFAGDVEPHGAGAGGDDHGLGPVLVATHPDGQRVAREVDLGDVGGHEAGAEAFGLLTELLHQLGAHDAVGEPGVVLYVGGDHQLAAGLASLEDEGVEVGPGGVEGGGVPGRSASDDDEVFDSAHGSSFGIRFVHNNAPPSPNSPAWMA
jgi:hypothetical protein